MKLTHMKCVPCEAGTPPLNKEQVAEFLLQLKGWKVIDGKKLQKVYKFKSYPETIAFVNKVALIAQEEGHHPDLEVHYSNCVVEFTTHAIKGLSENDFVMAAKIDE